MEGTVFEMNPLPNFSVILATYNQESHLPGCIESVLSQEGEEFEFIIVNDGSTDETRKVIERYACKFPDTIVTIHLPVNGGQARAFNHGINKARGPLVAFIDSDDRWYPNKLKVVGDTFGDPATVALHQHNLDIVGDESRNGERFCSILKIGDLFSDEGDAGDIVTLSSMAPTSGLTFSARALELMGLIPESFRVCADAFMRRAVLPFGRVSGVDLCCGSYGLHETNSTVGNASFDSDLFISDLLHPELDAFYRRTSIPISLGDGDFGSSLSLLCLREGDRVLLVRSTPPTRIKQIVTELRRATAGIQIDLLAQASAREMFSSLPVNLVEIPPGLIGEETLTKQIRSELIENGYTCVLIPYLNTDGSGYENVETALCGVGVTCPVIGIGSNGIVRSIKHQSLHMGARQSSKGKRSWADLRGVHSGKRAFIVGNGPSLQLNDLECLTGEVTFASNKIYLAFDSVDWRPDYYTVCDHMVARQNCESIRKLDLEMLLPVSLQGFDCSNSSVLWYPEHKGNEVFRDDSPVESENSRFGFSKEAVFGIHGGYTVLYHQLQLAYHMGIREIYLVGVDFSFSVPKSNVVDTRFNDPAHREALVSGGEVNHFHPDYRKAGEHWTIPRLDLQALAFRKARAIFEADGGFVRNASRHTALVELERVDFDVLLR